MENHKDESQDRSSIIRTVQTPLGFFTLVVLISEVILGTLAARAAGGDFTLLVIGMLLVLVLLVVAVVIIDVKGRAPLQQTRTDTDVTSLSGPEREQTQILVVVDKQLEHQLLEIGQNVQQVARRNNAILREEISQELNTLVIESGAWSRGELRSSAQRYNYVLLALYEQAKESIFSTTIRDYLVDWPEELMERMTAASERSRANSVTRVFVFAERKEIDEKAIKILRRFKQSSKVRPIVYIDDEDQVFNFPPDISRDFVVIDGGEVIGITLSYGHGNFQAQWYFGDENRKQRFRQMCSDLENGGRAVDEILRWWDAAVEADKDKKD